MAGSCMDWNQILALIGSNIALILASLTVTITLFLWSRSEAAHDRRQWHDEASQDRRDMLTLLRGIQDEMRDFHNRLYDLEKRRKDP